MESNNNHYDESICHYSSNEEVDLRPAEEEQEDEDENDEQQTKNSSLGGRWYECVFCKRGFNTAQALGGHMNIHRKDRAKNNPTSSISSSSSTMANCYTGPRVYQPILQDAYTTGKNTINHGDRFVSPNLDGPELGYLGYFPDQCCNNNDNYRKAGLYPYVGDDWRMKLSLELGSAADGGMVQDYHMGWKGERSRNQKELDLELRLGPGP